MVEAQDNAGPKGPATSNMNELEIQAVEARYFTPWGKKMTKAQRKANADFPFNPWKMAMETESWFKAVQWDGPKNLKKQLKKAGFNYFLLIAHLENMTRVLKNENQS